MSTFAVTLERITVLPHPDADRLELARVGMFHAVVGKGNHATGDTVFYVPEQALVPEKLQAVLNVEGKLAGSKKNRIKATRLRGELSQGLVIPVSAVTEHYGDTDGAAEVLDAISRYDIARDDDPDFEDETDFAQFFGVTKWEPVIPAAMQGKVAAEPDLIKWIDIENIKRYPNLFAFGEEVTATEKVHGSATILNVYKDGRIFVTSKGQGNKGLSIQEDEKNLYWRIVRERGLIEIAQQYLALAEKSVGRELVAAALYGETYGSGVQDLGYGVQGSTGYALFDVAVVDVNRNLTWLDHDIVYAEEIEVPRTPVIYRGPYNYETIAAIAAGKEQLSGTEANLREGVIVRPVVEFQTRQRKRKIAKFVTDEYLLRKNGTEYN